MALTPEADVTSTIEIVNRIPIISSLLEIVCRSTGLGFAAIARVTERQWLACAVRDEINFGLKPGEELQLETTLCNEVRQNHQVVVIDHVAQDALYCTHSTPAMYGFQSYISVPIFFKNGKFFGTLCAIDPKPATINRKETIGMFQFFADLIAYHFQTQEQLEIAEDNLVKEKQLAELREQFIAILGHDLRNPLSAITSSADVLMHVKTEPEKNKFALIVKNSAFRMNGLITSILDFAKGKMGGGIVMHQKVVTNLEDILRQVINELKAVWPEQYFIEDFRLSESVYVDDKRIAQLLSNLLGNAILHGAKNGAIHIKAISDEEMFSLSVTNSGTQIPNNIIVRLFQPFYRGDLKTGVQGLGLGLYISSEIAKSHGGTLEVESLPNQTTFIFKCPQPVEKQNTSTDLNFSANN